MDVWEHKVHVEVASCFEFADSKTGIANSNLNDVLLSYRHSLD